MTLQDLGSLGELVAALATVATLVYLGAQIRQNTRTVRANSHHAGSTAWAELTARLAADADLAGIYHRGRLSPDELSREDARRFDLILDAMVGQIENFYVQYRSGQLPQSNQDRFARILAAQFRTAGMQRYWTRRRDLYTEAFVRYIEDELALTPPAAAPGESVDRGSGRPGGPTPQA